VLLHKEANIPEDPGAAAPAAAISNIQSYTYKSAGYGKQLALKRADAAGLTLRKPLVTSGQGCP
jgi:hypothetical protein